MRRALLLFAVLATFSCGKEREDLVPRREGRPAEAPITGARDKALEYIFDESILPEVHIGVASSEWNRLLASFDADINTDEYVYCTATYIKDRDTTVVPFSGLRLRGNSSRRRPEGSFGESHNSSNPSWHHAHFTVNFHKYMKDSKHKVHGMEKLMLKWFKDDPLYVREIYCFDLFRRYGVWTALNDVHCRVFLKIDNEKEAYFGVYQMMEPVDDHYLERRKQIFRMFGGHENGYLWKCRWASSLQSTDDKNFDNNTDTKNHPYTLKTRNDEFPAAREMLKDFIEKVNMRSDEEFWDWIERACDVKLLLRTIAVTVAVGSWDDYWNNHNNWYLYFDRLDNDYKFYYIPFDFDYTLGTSGDTYFQKDAAIKDPLHWGTSAYPLIYRIIQKAEWRDYYVACLKELCDPEKDYLDYHHSIARIESWHRKISPYIMNDTGEDCEIRDEPASFGTTPWYRLLDTDPLVNFFRVKARVINNL
jgi:spore coat protein CotH